jgi:hypothetical protein
MLKEISFTITQVLNPFPTNLSANFIKNWSRKIDIKTNIENTNGMKWFFNMYFAIIKMANIIL